MRDIRAFQERLIARFEKPAGLFVRCEERKDFLLPLSIAAARLFEIRLALRALGQFERRDENLSIVHGRLRKAPL